MKQKLFPNIKRMTNLFCLGIFCVTASALALRLTVFSEMAEVVPETAVSSIVESEQGGYKINSKLVFPTVDSKGDIFASNMEDNDFLINVDVTLEESGESIFTTGFIKPGNSMNSVKLNPIGQELPDGLYPCVAEIIAHDPDSLKPVGSAKESITVQIGDVGAPEDAGGNETKGEETGDATGDDGNGDKEPTEAGAGDSGEDVLADEGDEEPSDDAGEE